MLRPRRQTAGFYLSRAIAMRFASKAIIREPPRIDLFVAVSLNG